MTHEEIEKEVEILDNYAKELLQDKEKAKKFFEKIIEIQNEVE